MPQNDFPSRHDARILRPQIEVLIRQAPPDRAIHGLKRIFQDCGHEVSVEFLVTGPASYAFLIEFENPQDAVDISLELNYLLFGHATLVIHVPQTGDLV